MTTAFSRSSTALHSTAQSVRNGVVKGPDPLILYFQSSHHLFLKIDVESSLRMKGERDDAEAFGLLPVLSLSLVFFLQRESQITPQTSVRSFSDDPSWGSSELSGPFLLCV